MKISPEKDTILFHSGGIYWNHVIPNLSKQKSHHSTTKEKDAATEWPTRKELIFPGQKNQSLGEIQETFSLSGVGRVLNKLWILL